MTFNTSKVFKVYITLLVITFIGCSHNLEIKNIDTLRHGFIEPLKQEGLKIGIVPNGGDFYADTVVKGIGTCLAERYRASVMMPYLVTDGSGFADYIIRITMHPKYEGSGWNFLINWPGFLVWTPAWNGYIYYVDYSMDVTITEAKTGLQRASFSVPAVLSIRHADLSRTWTEIGWLEFGVIPFVAGFFYIQYDDDVSPLVAEFAQEKLGGYVAGEIVSRLNVSYTVSKKRSCTAV